MVLFYDTERKEKKEKTKAQKWRGRIFKLLLVLFFTFGFSLFALSRIGGPYEPLKKGLEDYLSSETQLDVTINDFKGLYFFPQVKFQAGGITFKQNGKVLAKAGAVNISAGFWNIFFGRGRLKEFSVEKLSAPAGLWLPQSLDLSRLALDQTAVDGKPGLVAQGQYGPHKFTFSMASGFDKGMGGDKAGQAYYLAGDKHPFKFALGSYKASGTYEDQGRHGVLITIARFGDDNASVSGTVQWKKGMGKNLFNADMTGGKTELTADVTLRHDGVDFDANFDPILISDITGDHSVASMIGGFLDELSGPPAKGGGLTLPDEPRIKGTIHFKSVLLDEVEIGKLDLPVKMKNGKITLGPVSGDLADGTPSGQIVLDASSVKQAKLDINLALKDWQYGKFNERLTGQTNMSGTASLIAKLTSTGQSWQQLSDDITGDIKLVGGKGKFESSAMSFWGNGLLTTMLPDFDPEETSQLNCVIADFKVHKGIAEAKPLFMDTGRLTIIGKGKVNLSNQTMDILVSPKPKDMALVDVAIPVRIKGDVANPSIGPDKFSLGKKVGGLLLGTVNPIFWAINLTDFGLSDDNPCHSYFEKNKNNAEGQEQAPEKAPEKAEAAPVSNQNEMDNGRMAGGHDEAKPAAAAKAEGAAQEQGVDKSSEKEAVPDVKTPEQASVNK